MKRSFYLILFIIPLFFCPTICRASQTDLNFSYINSKRANAGEKTVWWQSESSKKSATSDINRLSLLLGESINKGLNKKEDYAHSVNFIISAYDGNGNFKKEAADSGNFTDEELSPTECAYSFWALARACKTADADLQAKAANIVEQIIKIKLESCLPLYEKKELTDVNGVKAPTWFIESRSDVSSIYVLGLVEYHHATKSQKAAALINALCDGIKIFSDNKYYEFPYCAHYESVENPYLWTLSNNRQMAALALGGKLLGNKEFITSAEDEANNLYAYLLSSYGSISGLAPSPVIFPQVPEAAQVMTENLITLANVTEKEQYYILAGISASWFFGGNAISQTIYKSETGSCSISINEKGAAQETSLYASVEALSALVSIYNTVAWDYRHLKQKKQPHCFIVLQAEDGKAVRKDYEIEPIDYPGGTTGNIVAIKRENSFWIRFTIDEPNDYSFHLVYLKQYGFATGTSILMRIDGDKIYSVPLGGSTSGTYMIMQEVLEPRALLPGLHSMGIKFSGLLLGKAAKLDCVVLQPLFQRRVFTQPSGKEIAIVKSFHNESSPFNTEILSNDEFAPISYIISNNITKNRINSHEIKIPAHGYAIIEGQGKK